MRKEIIVKFYGWIRDKVGVKELKIAEFDKTIEEVLREIDPQGEILESIHEGRLFVTLNHSYVRDLNVRLKDGDVIALFPEFSGGARGRAELIINEIDISSEIRRIISSSDRIGGIACFIGVVRGISEGKKVVKLYYDYYPELAEKNIKEIREKAIKDFNLIDATLLHKVGEAKIGEVVLLAIAASEHRDEAFKAARWMVEEVKKGIAVWKKEYFEEGERWVSPD